VLAVHGARPVQDRAGFWRKTDADQREFYVFPEVFVKDIARGYDSEWLAKLLVQRGWVQPDRAGKTARLARLPTIGVKRVYRFLPTVLSTTEPMEVDDGDLTDARKSAE